ncbi:D-alanyl-D-alanine carboxypeptidase/D-alanyl-D-alanine-endopeptidase [Robertkochia aurantiaca]|uniref:D-alanyl-D-alanine carboxypeptidase/D-alanyl-D-alanine-endopeptidase n=1 Tax=Robertkochia aurantiaca TaxID=2873700 RepID=UPI001CCF7334|nr:D-alanyl-D-alanine carboxypeptidase [Robertkochia sp. 3YJGBD-33]
MLNKYLLFLLSVFLFIVSCGVKPHKKLKEEVDRQVSSPFFKNQFTGFFVFDPETGDTVYSHNADKYFTPASNTKILTLFSAMELLPEKLPALQYQYINDTLLLRGTGDPTLLHPYFELKTPFEFVRNFDPVALVWNNFDENPLGPGWSWGDFDAYYSPERSALPLHGNIVLGGLDDQGEGWISPRNFTYRNTANPSGFQRDRHQNIFYLNAKAGDTLEIPYITDSTAVKNILSKALQREVHLKMKHTTTDEWRTLYGIKADSVYKRMMMVSDNFIAEQLLIQASGMLSDTLSGAKTRDYILEGPLSDLSQKPRWVDGSGLSRYNLITPEALVHVLFKLYKCYGKERLLQLFPAGGVSGTLKNYFKGDGAPYVYAKTGTLSNNYCLSGYLLTDSGKTLIFSFMNNHYMGSSIPVKKEMEPILYHIKKTY